MPRKLTTVEARKMSQARKNHGAGSGRPQDPARCPCGEMSVRRAKARYHRC